MSDIDTTQSPSSVFYGYFSKYTWRNEKNGNSFFRIVTKQELFFEQQYCKKEVKKNPITEQEETLYTISCDGSKYPVPAYDEKTPIRIRGFFRNLHDKGFGWDFQITDIRESTSDEITTIEYLNSEAFPGVTYQNAVDIVRSYFMVKIQTVLQTMSIMRYQARLIRMEILLLLSLRLMRK